MEFKALQPKREISPIARFVIGAKESCDVTIAARIYADTLAEPVDQELQLRLNVTRLSIKAEEVMQDIAGQSSER